MTHPHNGAVSRLGGTAPPLPRHGGRPMADATQAETPEEVEGEDGAPSEPLDDPTGDEGEGEDVQVADETEGVVEPKQAEPEGPQPPQTEREMEKRQKAWDAERDRHMEKAEAADDYRYSISTVCPLCEGHGLLVMPDDPAGQAQMRAFILALVGEATPEELHDHPNFHRCDTCDGYGKVRTGSRVANQEALNCPDCNGQGHTGGKSQVAVLPTVVPSPEPSASVPPEEQARIGNDAWGRPPGHPHYGLLPAQVQ